MQTSAGSCSALPSRSSSIHAYAEMGATGHAARLARELEGLAPK
jgi:hypothetical protein